MRVDITELDAAGHGVAVQVAVDLAEAFPDDDERSEVMAALATRGEAMAGGGAAPGVRITLTRRRPPAAGAAFAIRVRPKTGPSGAGAPHPNDYGAGAPHPNDYGAGAPRLNDYGAGAPHPNDHGAAARPAPPAQETPAGARSLAGRIAAVMQRQTAETGACTVRDLRQAGLSYRQITRHADAARELIASAEFI